MASLFNHFVGNLLEVQRHIEAQSLRGFHVDDQLEFRWLLHGQVGWFLALKNPSHIGAGEAEGSWKIGAVAHQATSFGEFAKMINCGKSNASHRRDQLFATTSEIGVGKDENRSSALSGKISEGGVELGILAGIRRYNSLAPSGGGRERRPWFRQPGSGYSDCSASR